MNEGFSWTRHADVGGPLHSFGELRSFGCRDSQPAAQLSWQQHQEWTYEIVFVEQGLVNLRLSDGDALAMRAGDVCCIAPGQRGADSLDVISPCRIWWLHVEGPAPDLDSWLQLSPTERSALLERLHRLERVLFVGMRLVEPLRRIRQAIEQHDPLSVLQARQGVLDILLSLILSVRRTDSQEVYGLVERLERRLQQDWTWRPTVAELAADCGFSPSHYHRLFREYTGLAPLTYMERLRIEHAGRCLQGDQRLRISDLSKELGYASSQHFATVFKRLMRVTPTIWQQRGQAKKSLISSTVSH